MESALHFQRAACSLTGGLLILFQLLATGFESPIKPLPHQKFYKRGESELKNKIDRSLRNGEVRAYTLHCNIALSQATTVNKNE